MITGLPGRHLRVVRSRAGGDVVGSFGPEPDDDLDRFSAIEFRDRTVRKGALGEGGNECEDQAEGQTEKRATIPS